MNKTIKISLISILITTILYLLDSDQANECLQNRFFEFIIISSIIFCFIYFKIFVLKLYEIVIKMQ